MQKFSKPKTSDMTLIDLNLLHLISMHAKDWALNLLILLHDVLLAAKSCGDRFSEIREA